MEEGCLWRWALSNLSIMNTWPLLEQSSTSIQPILQRLHRKDQRGLEGNIYLAADFSSELTNLAFFLKGRKKLLNIKLTG